MPAVRHWSVRHARAPEACYGLFERVSWHPDRSTEPQPQRATS